MRAQIRLLDVCGINRFLPHCIIWNDCGDITKIIRCEWPEFTEAETIKVAKALCRERGAVRFERKSALEYGVVFSTDE